MQLTRSVVITICLLLIATQISSAQGLVNSEMPQHEAVLDSNQKLLAWHGPGKNLGYDQAVRLAWDFMEHKVKNDPKSGLKIYLINSVYDETTGLGEYWQHNPASTYAQFVDSLVTWYAYSGDREAETVVRTMLDYQLAHGTTNVDWDWGSVPFPTACGNDVEYGHCLQDAPRSYYGGIEPDKVGELGMGYALFYEFTGDKKYLDAAVKCADALTRHIRPGDETHTPWPFRVDGRSGVTINQYEYGGMVVAPVRLFAELVRLKAGDVNGYARSRDLAWQWLMKYPMRNNHWVGYFEDVPKYSENENQALPTMVAHYILSQPDPSSVDPQWIGDVGRLLDWVRKKYGRGPFFGAWAIDEQGGPPSNYECCSRAGLASDTVRWGAMNALYYEKTRDGQAREDAFRSLNYATYFAASDGKIPCCGFDSADAYWWDDGYGDYIRNFMWAMAAVPQWAPKGQDHILGATSVVKTVEYDRHRLHYSTFDQQGTEVLRLSYAPQQVVVDGETLKAGKDLSTHGFTVAPLDGGDYLVRVRHLTSGDVRIAN